MRANGTIECCIGIRSRIARKWLNRLGYKWKDIQKGVFFDGHKHKDVVEYQGIFREEIKHNYLTLSNLKRTVLFYPKNIRIIAQLGVQIDDQLL